MKRNFLVVLMPYYSYKIICCRHDNFDEKDMVPPQKEFKKYNITYILNWICKLHFF